MRFLKTVSVTALVIVQAGTYTALANGYATAECPWNPPTEFQPSLDLIDQMNSCLGGPPDGFARDKLLRMNIGSIAQKVRAGDVDGAKALLKTTAIEGSGFNNSFFSNYAEHFTAPSGLQYTLIQNAEGDSYSLIPAPMLGLIGGTPLSSDDSSINQLMAQHHETSDQGSAALAKAQGIVSTWNKLAHTYGMTHGEANALCNYSGAGGPDHAFCFSADFRLSIGGALYKDYALLLDPKGPYIDLRPLTQAGEPFVEPTFDSTNMPTNATNATNAFADQPSSLTFSDVSPVDPAAQAIAWMKTKGIVSGYADGTYGPNKTINRAEFVKIVVGSQMTNPTSQSCDMGTPSFSDVPADAWYAKDVCLGKQLGLIGGYADGTFRPNRAINAAEAAKIVVNAYETSPVMQAGAATWYAPYQTFLQTNDALPQSVTSMWQPITRRQMAQIVFGLASCGCSRLQP